MKRFRYLDHTADIKIEAYGKTKEKAFSNFLLGICNIMYDIDNIKKETKKTIFIKKKDDKRMLYEIIEEAIYLLEVERYYIGDIYDIEINENGLRAIAIGEKESDEEIKTEIKAMTYHEMEIIEKENSYVVRGVVDI